MCVKLARHKDVPVMLLGFFFLLILNNFKSVSSFGKTVW